MLSPRCQHRVSIILIRPLLKILIGLGFAAGGFEVAHAAAPASPPLGLPAFTHTPDQGRVALGARLFFDPVLSSDGSMACSTCHRPEQAFTQNGIATPIGSDGLPLRRNAPTLLNVGYRQRLFHDGRESDLARQPFSPLLAANEMGNRALSDVIQRLAAAPDYVQAFNAAFEEGLSAANLGRALADYQRTLRSAASPFDRWYYGGDTQAMSADAKAGFFVFSASGCGDCHRFTHGSAQFTDDGLHRTGVTGPDRGLEEITGNPEDRYRFRTPTLRNVALTAPYMHDGSLATLMDVVTFYNAGGGRLNGQPTLQPLDLSNEDLHVLVVFLRSLTGD